MKQTAPHDLLVALLLLQNSLERRSDAFFQPFGLTSAQFNILNLLESHGGRMPQAQLAELLLVGKSSVSIVLQRMVRARLLRREEHPVDRRQVILTATAAGRALWRKISPRYEATVVEIFGALAASRRSRLLADLAVLQAAFSAPESTGTN